MLRVSRIWLELAKRAAARKRNVNIPAIRKTFDKRNLHSFGDALEFTGEKITGEGSERNSERERERGCVRLWWFWV